MGFVENADDEDGGNFGRGNRLIRLFCDCLEELKKITKRLFLYSVFSGTSPAYDIDELAVFRRLM
jgi:hypothetical protein